MTATSDLKEVLELLKQYDVGQVRLKLGELELECTFNKALDKVNQAGAAKSWSPTKFGIPGSPPELNYATSTLSAADQNDLSVIGPALGFAPTKKARVKHIANKDES